MNPVLLKCWSRKTRKKVDIGLAFELVAHDARELLHNLGKAIAVPDWEMPIHWWSDQVETLRVELRCIVQDRLEVLDDRLDPEGDRRHGLVGARHEVGDAGKHGHVGGLTNLTKSFSKNRDLATRDNLGPGHQRSISTTDRVHVPLNIRISDQRKNLADRHYVCWRSALRLKNFFFQLQQREERVQRGPMKTYFTESPETDGARRLGRQRMNDELERRTQLTMEAKDVGSIPRKPKEDHTLFSIYKCRISI